MRLVAIPPPLMVESLAAGLVDGFCVGEPWNSLAVAQGLGSIVVTQSQLLPGAAEKVLAVRAAFAEAPEPLTRLLRALDAAAAWADEPMNHRALAGHLARPDYLGVGPSVIERASGSNARPHASSVPISIDAVCRSAASRRRCRCRSIALPSPQSTCPRTRAVFL